jgi:hypothetical protein
VIDTRRSRRERDAFVQSASVAERASAGFGPRASTRAIRVRRLSEGIRIEASIMARLLRLRLLTVDASILLLPVGDPPAADETRTRVRAASTRDTHGRRLADAIRSLDEAEQGLVRAREQNGS